MAVFPSSIQTPFEQRRGVIERGRSIEGSVHRVTGTVKLDGSGEVLVDVNFPVWFQETPNMTFGGELVENEIITPGRFPTISVIVKSWVKQRRNIADYYAGATLIVVSTGEANQRMIAHWAMEGKALRNPLGGVGGIDDPI